MNDDPRRHRHRHRHRHGRHRRCNRDIPRTLLDQYLLGLSPQGTPVTGGPDVLATARAIESVLAIITQVFACGVEEDWELKVALSLLVTNGLDSHALCPLRRILGILRDAGNGNLLRADEETGRLSIDLPQDFQACRSNRSTGPAPPDDSPDIDEALDDSTAAGFNDDDEDEDKDDGDGDDGKTDPGTSEEGIH